jgi:hypothetical protein
VNLFRNFKPEKMKSPKRKMVRRANVALNLPAIIELLIMFAKSIVKAMTGNAFFASSAPKITVVNTDIAAVEVAQVGFTSVPQTVTLEARDLAVEQLKNSLRALKGDVQAVADANPAKASVIIASAGMAIKKSGSNARSQDIATDGPVAGSVNLSSEGKGPREWRMSTDGINRVNLPATTTQKTMVSGLAEGTEYYFQYRLILPNGQISDWSESIYYKTR